MSSASMALAGTGHSFNPSTLNAWLKGHGGYASGDLLIWGAIKPLGLTFQGKVSNGQIKSKLDQGLVVICNVDNGGHWVLATGYSGDNIMVNDPGYPTTSYALSQIVDGQNGVYALTGTEEGRANHLKALIRSVPSKWWKMADGGKINEVEQN